MRGFLKAIFNYHNVFPWILILISAFLAFKSWVPGTWLSGWDTLHPEFNFGLSLERLFFGVFRSEQGLGAVAAHSHMADLPRVVFLALASLIFSTSILRYLFISLCLIVGGLGSFVFIKKILLKDTKYNSVFAFLGSLFYLLNLGTLQQFYVPFEMFTVQYALLPWLFLFTTKYLFESKKKNLVLFGLVTLLSTPMAFASTLWFAYFLVFILYLAMFLKNHFKKVIILIVLTLFINSFWLLPTAYFVISGNAGFVALAKANKIFSQEAFSYNKSYGTISDTIIFKNFLFDWVAFDGKNGFEYLFQGWREHINSPQTQLLGYTLATIAFLGLCFGVISRNRVSIALILPAVMAIVFLINQNPPLDGLFSIFRERIPLFSEALRFPFTKFSIILAFIMACFFGLGQKFAYSLVNKASIYKFSKILLVIQLSLFSVLFFIYMKPAFSGDFISKKIQVAIPKEYFEMFDWFNSQPNGRIATFPVHSFWGWVYYKWGFQGAQFISFGIKQPLMDRDYDRWNFSNEQYFREMSYAIYSQNSDLLAKVIQKYQIKYLLLDRNVANPGSGQDKTALYYDQIESLFAANKDIKLVHRFGKISVYEVQSENRGLVSAPEKFIQTKGGEGQFDIDEVFKDFGTYISSTSQEIPLVNYPYRYMVDNQNFVNNQVFNTDSNNFDIVTQNIQSRVLSYQDYIKQEPSIPVSLYLKQEKDSLQVKLIFKLAGKSYSYAKSLSIPDKNSFDISPEWLINLDNSQTLVTKNISSKAFTYQGDLLFSTSSPNNLAFYNPSEDAATSKVSDAVLQKLTVGACSDVDIGSMESLQVLEGRSLKITAKNVNTCVKLPLNQVIDAKDVKNLKSLVHLSFGTTSSTGTSGHYCLFDTVLGRCIKEQKYLPVEGFINDYFIVDNYSLDKLALIYYVDGLGNETNQQVIYSNLTLSVKNYSDLITIFPNDIKSTVLTAQTIQGNGQPDNNLFGAINILEKGHQSSSCSNIVPKKYSRVVDEKNKIVEYSSEEGSSCDFFSLPDLPHNTGYLLNIESQNVAGLPLRLCLANSVSKRCDIYISLPADKQFTRHVILIPPMADGGVGYELHFDNYSTGRIISTNRIKSLNIQPFPYYWLTGMHQPTTINPLVNTTQIKSAKEILPSLIQITYDNPSNNHGLIVLNRSFEEGWFGSRGEHVKVNGWANGWLIGPNQKGGLMIFYWPQLLEWGGFILMIGTFLYIGIRYLDKR